MNLKNPNIRTKSEFLAALLERYSNYKKRNFEQNEVSVTITNYVTQYSTIQIQEEPAD